MEVIGENNFKLYQGENGKENLIIAHGYGRCGNFYKNLISKILENGKYKRVFSFDFPGHGTQKEGISFNDSKESLFSKINFISNNFDGNLNVWGHSYGAYITSFLAENNSDYNINGLVNRLTLSSLPLSMNGYKYMEFLRRVKSPHDKIMNSNLIRFYIKAGVFSVENNMLRCRDLIIPDIKAYAKELLSMPSLTENISSISIPTTIIRSRVDGILGILSLQGENGIRHIGSNGNAYDEFNKKFGNLNSVVIGGGHGLGVQKVDKNPYYISKDIQTLINNL